MATRLHLTDDDVQQMSEYLRKQRNLGSSSYDAPPQIVNDPLSSKGEGLKQAGMGALKYVFNVLDQPKSAITTGLLYSWDKDNKTNPFLGFLQGLAGQKHTSTSDILKEDFGVKNKLALGLAGFAGDIALDPLTYVGLAPVKGFSEGEAMLKATQQVGEAVNAGTVAAEEMPQAVADLAKQMGKENPYRFKVEVGLPGRKQAVGTIAEPAVVNKLREFVKGPEGDARGIVQAFSRKAEQPFGLAEDSRKIEGKYAGDMNRNQRALLKLHNEVAPETRSTAALAYEDPVLYDKVKNVPLVTRDTVGGVAGAIMGMGTGNTSALAEATDGGIKTIGDYVDFVRSHRRDMLETEMKMGMNRHLLPKEQAARQAQLFGTEPYRTAGKATKGGTVIEWKDLSQQEKNAILDSQNKLLPKRVLKPKELESVRGLNKQLGKAGETHFNPDMMSFDELSLTNAQPVIDIGDSHITAMANSFRDQTRAAVTRRALETLGMKADTPEGIAMIDHLAANDSMGIKWTNVQRASGPNALVNEIAQHSDFKNMVIPESIQNVLNTQERILTNDDLGTKFMKYFDRVMSHWKALNTTLNPGYMTRNAIGDVIANFADGVFDPRRYLQAHQVLSEVKRNDVIDLAETLRNPTEGLRSFPDLKAPSDVAINIGGRNHTPREIWRAGTDNGIFSGDIITEKMKGAVTADPGAAAISDAGSALKFSNIKDTLDKNVMQTTSNAVKLAEAKMADLNIARETNQRYAHFIDRYDKEVTQGLKDYAKANKINSTDLGAIRGHMGEEAATKLEQTAAETAAERVRKFNIDYGSLSTFEKKYMKRVIPFYSFFRKNAPLQASMLFTKPGFMNAYPKTFEAMQNILGTNDGNGDWMVPDWIRESMPVRLAAAGVQGNIVSQLARFASGASDNTAVFLPMMQGLTPASDLGTLLNPIQRAVDTHSPWQGARVAAQETANMSLPPVKGLAELATGKTIQSGAPITDWNQWAVAATLGAPGRLAYTLSPFGTKDRAQALTATALGPQLRNVDQQMQQSEFQRRKDLANIQKNKLRSALAKQMGISQDDPEYSKINSYDIQRILDYMREAGRSVGTY